jgi:hypothetical protein
MMKVTGALGKFCACAGAPTMRAHRLIILKLTMCFPYDFLKRMSTYGTSAFRKYAA